MNKPNLIDTHAHLDDPAFNKDREEVLLRARQAGVRALINPGSDLGGSQRAVEYAHRTSNVFAAVGLHPHEVLLKANGENNLRGNAKSINIKQPARRALGPEFEQALAQLEEWSRDPAVVGIGEFGLDLKDSAASLEVQRQALVAQIKIANRQSLPIILHCRALYDELIKILEDHPPAVAGVVHCFTGSPQQLKKLLAVGLYVAFGGIVTFNNNTEELRQAVMEAPLERLLLETDAPYLSPEPNRGKRNEPAQVSVIAQFIADLREISYSELAEATTSNAREVFALPDALETSD